MRRVLAIARKLRGRDPAELLDRVRQRADVARERTPVGRRLLDVGPTALARRLAPRVAADPAALLAAFRSRADAGALPGLADPRATAALVRDRWPADADAAVRRAERVLAGRFDLLGYEGLDWGTPIDWQRDPVHGRSAPMVHWSRVPYLDFDVVGDHKVTWELNRQQYLVALGQAWLLTGDDRFAQGVADHLTAWMDGNPPKLGINWASSLEVGFRAMAWVTALHLVRDAAAIAPPLYARALQYLDVHARHLERHLSTYFSPNTHLTGEALALVHLGVLLPELRGAARWQRQGLAVLEAWFPRQVRADGTYFEQATQYHRYTTEFVAHLVVLAEANGVALAPHLRPMLDRLYDHLLHLTRPDGTIPLIGDDDGGRLAHLDDRPPHDVRSAHAIGAALLDRADLAFAAAGDASAAAWLLGPAGVERLDRLRPAPPVETSRAFADGGAYVMRSGWGPDALHLVFDGGPHGAMNCGHAHADALAVVAHAHGRDLLVDAGTYSYPGPERDRFRGTAAHSTVTVDGLPSSEPASPFQWETRAAGRVECWHAGGGAAFVRAVHDGYERLAEPATHRREVLLAGHDGWVVRDVVESAGAHDVAVRWHAAPGLAPRLDGGASDGADGGAVVLEADGHPALVIAAFGADGPELTAGWVSPRYGGRVQAPILGWTRHGCGRAEVVTFLLPVGPGASVPHVTELEQAGPGRAFAVRSPEGDGLLLLGSRGVVADGHAVDTDAAWLRLRFAADGELREWAAVDARHVVVDGRVLLDAADVRAWTTGDADGGDRAERGEVPPDTGSGAG